MSISRSVTVDYNLQALAQAAEEQGFFVLKSSAANGWYGVMPGAENCELVIRSRNHRFDMGFVRQADGKVKLMADAHGGHVQNDLATKILPRYMEIMLQRHRHRVISKAAVKNGVELRVGRV